MLNSRKAMCLAHLEHSREKIRILYYFLIYLLDTCLKKAKLIFFLKVFVNVLNTLLYGISV